MILELIKQIYNKKHFKNFHFNKRAFNLITFKTKNDKYKISFNFSNKTNTLQNFYVEKLIKVKNKDIYIVEKCLYDDKHVPNIEYINKNLKKYIA